MLRAELVDGLLEKSRMMERRLNEIQRRQEGTRDLLQRLLSRPALAEGDADA